MNNLIQSKRKEAELKNVEAARFGMEVRLLELEEQVLLVKKQYEEKTLELNNLILKVNEQLIIQLKAEETLKQVIINIKG